MQQHNHSWHWFPAQHQARKSIEKQTLDELGKRKRALYEQVNNTS